MKDLGKKNVLGVLVDAVDYEAAVDRTIIAARLGQPYGVSALAVHGVMTGVRDTHQRYRLNSLELVVPDGQPVRWALNLLYRTGLEDQVRGTAFTLRVLEQAETDGLPVYFYGSREAVLHAMLANLSKRFPQLAIAGASPSLFRTVGADEQHEIVNRIRASGAKLVFVGLGCPRQERFVYALRERLTMPTIAVGAAFDYLAGTLRDPPERMRRIGLEWLWRLWLEPRRLWRRYLALNPAYLGLLALQTTRLWSAGATGLRPEGLEPVDA